MADNVIVQVTVDVMTWYRANKAMLMEGTTLEGKLREYMHYLVKQALRNDEIDQRENNDSKSQSDGDDVHAPRFRKTGLRCYDRYAHRVIDTGEIWAGGTPEVVEVHPLESYWIEVRFDDGRHGVFDVNPYLKWPALAKLKDVDFFNKVHVAGGTACWPEDIDIAPERIWTDCESVVEHWTYPEDWPKVGSKGPDGSPIVFVTDKGFPVTDKLEDKWAEEFEREDFRWDPDAPIFIGNMIPDSDLERMDQEDRKKMKKRTEAEIEELRRLSSRSGEESGSLLNQNLTKSQQICELMIAMRKQAGISLEEMSKRTGISASELWKAEDGSSRSSLLDYLADYCTALGKTFTMTITDAGDDAAERR